MASNKPPHKKVTASRIAQQPKVQKPDVKPSPQPNPQAKTGTTKDKK